MDEFEKISVNDFQDNDILYLNHDNYFDNDLVDMYDYYIKDVKCLNKKTNDDKNMLLREINLIIKELNKLFDLVIGNVQMEDDRIVPWISDKFEYCINNCDNIYLLNDIEKLYNQYINKRNILLESYLKFVIKLAKSFRGNKYGLTVDDLIQYGNIGLIRAIEMYDSEKNVEFLTYAGYWIKQSIMYNSKKMMHQIKFPIRWFDVRIKRARAIECLTQEYGRYPTNDEVASYIQVDSKKLEMIIDAFKESVSIDDLIDSDLNELSDVFPIGREVSKVEFISDNTIDLDRNMEYEQLVSEITYYMDLYLNEREKFILKSRYGFIEEVPMLELSKMYGVSESRIYQIEHNARIKLYKNQEFKKMKVYLR